MTFTEYKVLIEQWTTLANNAGLTLSNGDPIPFTFWKAFLGLKRKVHQEIFNGNYKIKSKKVPAYLSQSIHFIQLLASDVFIEEIKTHIPIFEADKVS